MWCFYFMPHGSIKDCFLFRDINSVYASTRIVPNTPLPLHIYGFTDFNNASSGDGKT